VLVNGYVGGVDAPFISNDDVASMELAVAHLVSLGHTRIGLAVGPQRFVPVIRKVQGFTAAMRTVAGTNGVTGSSSGRCSRSRAGTRPR
jgi:DNA-binding LacI/PurR family transcriptional regulator